MALSTKSLEGNLETIILALLEKQDSYGYALNEAISEQSKNWINLKEGTLYPLLHRMEKHKWISSYWAKPEGQRKRKYYAITDSGTQLLKEKRQEWETLKEIFSAVVEKGGKASKRPPLKPEKATPPKEVEASPDPVVSEEQLPSWLL